jgi:cobalt-precorrin 5A hydrolase
MIVAGFGFRKGVHLDSLRDALERARRETPIVALATLDTKAQELQPLAKLLDLPLCPISREAAARQTTITRSTAAQAAHGTGSVAEATALAAAAGRAGTARLLGPRAISADRTATCALAEGEIK